MPAFTTSPFLRLVSTVAAPRPSLSSASFLPGLSSTQSGLGKAFSAPVDESVGPQESEITQDSATAPALVLDTPTTVDNLLPFVPTSTATGLGLSLVPSILPEDDRTTTDYDCASTTEDELSFDFDEEDSFLSSPPSSPIFSDRSFSSPPPSPLFDSAPCFVPYMDNEEEEEDIYGDILADVVRDITILKVERVLREREQRSVDRGTPFYPVYRTDAKRTYYRRHPSTLTCIAESAEELDEEPLSLVDEPEHFSSAPFDLAATLAALSAKLDLLESLEDEAEELNFFEHTLADFAASLEQCQAECVELELEEEDDLEFGSFLPVVRTEEERTHYRRAFSPAFPSIVEESEQVVVESPSAKVTLASHFFFRRAERELLDDTFPFISLNLPNDDFTADPFFPLVATLSYPCTDTASIFDEPPFVSLNLPSDNDLLAAPCDPFAGLLASLSADVALPALLTSISPPFALKSSAITAQEVEASLRNPGFDFGFPSLSIFEVELGSALGMGGEDDDEAAFDLGCCRVQ
ncbi:hypothetical protein JCM10207_000140 [Rhodosporidiobolus poonsookiae]